jgi:membrane protein required for colicin V production
VWTGFVRQLSFVIALVLAFLVAGRFYLYFAGFMHGVISTPQLAFLLTYLLLFGAVYLTVIFAGLAVKKFLKVSMLGGFDRFMGGLFGMGKGLFIIILLFTALAGLLANSATFLRKSYFYPFLNGGSQLVMSFINDPGLRASFKPKEPAIPSFFAGAGNPAPGGARTVRPQYQGALADLRAQLAREVGDRPRR